MEVEVDFSGGWPLAGDLRAPEAALAATELEAVLGASGGAGAEILLSHREGAGDGFRRQVAPGQLRLEGDSPRGLLCGAYATLEELGARWDWPGQDASPGRVRARLAARREDAPALEGRCLVLGERALLEEADDWIVWAARRRLNAIFVHVSTRPDPAGAAPEALWRQCRDRAAALARERGVAIEHGGHLLPELLSTEDLRAMAKGGAPSREGLGILEEHVRAHPEADVVHLWGADLPAGGGGGQAASEAALRTANAVAEVVEGVSPRAQVAYLAYHDTEDVPRGVAPRPNVCLVFAPRERCYEHALTDPGCRRNARHRELFCAQVEHFAAAGAAPARVFEYWFDAILFAGGVPDLTQTMARDLAFYHQAGAHTVQMLMTGHGRSPRPHPNLPAFARLAWSPQPRAGPTCAHPQT